MITPDLLTFGNIVGGIIQIAIIYFVLDWTDRKRNWSWAGVDAETVRYRDRELHR